MGWMETVTGERVSRCRSTKRMKGGYIEEGNRFPRRAAGALLWV
jgi:hypothetical protein